MVDVECIQKITGYTFNADLPNKSMKRINVGPLRKRNGIS